MDTSEIQIFADLIPKGYINLCVGARNASYRKIQELVTKGKIPNEGWPESLIEQLLTQLSQMDSNNFPGNVGVGEREGRVYSDLVKRRHFRLSHGVGRSGDVTALQPKAAGSSALNVLTNKLLLDSLKIAGATGCTACFLVPTATGMALTLCMQTFRSYRPLAKYVIWPRIDQMSCFKSIIAAGFQPVVIENLLSGDQLNTNLEEITSQIESLGADNILCIMSTTSCFAPRAIDSVERIAQICSEQKIPHLINNAYGVQSTKCMHIIQQASRIGRVDAFVQSTDKNYMVPVGGAIIAGYNELFIHEIAKMYPGRASASPSIDMLITLLSMGSTCFKKLITERKTMYHYLKDEVSKTVARFNERVLDTPQNPISIGVTLSNPNLSSTQLTEIGSMLFTRNVSGIRVITGKDYKEAHGCKFIGFGSHHSSYPCPYFTVAAGIGITRSDVEHFCKKLDKVLTKMYTPSPSPPQILPDN